MFQLVGGVTLHAKAERLTHLFPIALRVWREDLIRVAAKVPTGKMLASELVGRRSQPFIALVVSQFVAVVEDDEIHSVACIGFGDFCPVEKRPATRFQLVRHGARDLGLCHCVIQIGALVVYESYGVEPQNSKG